MELITINEAALIAHDSQNATPLEIRRNPTRFPRIKQYRPDALLNEMKKNILMVYQYRGQKPSNAQEVEMMARSLTAELMADELGYDTKELAMEDIRRALRRAGLRQGADMYGINVGSLYNAILDYRRTEIEDARQQLASERRSSEKIGSPLEVIHQKYAAMMAQAAKERGEDV